MGVQAAVSEHRTLKTINLQTVRHHELPDCYDFHIMVGVGGRFWWLSLNMISTRLSLFVQIIFDNHAHSGKITVNVETDVRIYECRDWTVEGKCERELVMV